MRTLSLILLAGLLTACMTGKPKHVLIYTKNGEGYVHDNISASVEALKKICKENKWTCEATDDPTALDEPKINSFDVLVFSNTNNETIITPEQTKAFMKYIRAGNGFVGIHSACGSEREWPWFWAMLGGKFLRHPKFQPFDIKVIDGDHPSTAHLGPVWKWEDECYYLHHLNPDIHVLLAADLTTVEDDKKTALPGDIFGDLFPLCWCHEFDGGRQWYTALGHLPEHYEDENFVKHLTGGMRWAMDIDD